QRADAGQLDAVIAERNGFRRARDATVVSNRRREPEHPAGALVFENYWRKLGQYVVGIREPRHPRLRDVLDGKRAEPDRIVRSNGEERLGAALDTAGTICLRNEQWISGPHVAADDFAEVRKVDVRRHE